jgi:hypothetical protein
LSHVETRQVQNDYTFSLDGQHYQIERRAIVSGLRKANVRTEQRLDGSLAVRFGDQYLPVKPCEVTNRRKTTEANQPAKAQRVRRRSSDWNKNFDLKKSPTIWQAAQESGHRTGEAL